MTLDASALIAAVSVTVSGTLGLASVWLALRKKTEDEVLARATRRTTALQLLSDEEFVLIRVRDECISLQDLIAVAAEKLGSDYEHFAGEVLRIVGESAEMLQEVRAKRRTIQPQIQSLSAAEIESVIASAYHGKRLAEAQLQRTLLSKSETLRRYPL